MYDGVNGTEVYLNLKSIDVQEYNPPHYQIAGQIVTVCNMDDSIQRDIVTLRYNYYTKETFFRNEYGNWIIYVKRESNNYTPVYYYKLRIANALFKAAYRMNFYD